MKAFVSKINSMLLVSFSLVLSVNAYAAGGATNEYVVPAPINPELKSSLQNGAKLFVNHCLGCHSASYMRYERMAEDLGIPKEITKQNLMFTGDKIGSLMLSSIPVDDAKKWFGAPPPDLTYTARVRGVDWLYSYLINFYADESRPWGVNNHVFENVGMPHVLEGMQASMSDEEFKGQMADLTNFLDYTSEPIRAERKRLGKWVLLYLFILLIPVYFLNKEYWKDVH